MLRVVLLSALLAPAAVAQRPAELSAAERAAAVARLDSLLSIGPSADSVARPAVASSASPGSARLAFPTKGGVFYYRAGEGTAFRRAPLRVDRPASGAVARRAGDAAQPAQRAGDPLGAAPRRALAEDRNGADTRVREGGRQDRTDRDRVIVDRDRPSDRQPDARPVARPDVTEAPVTRPGLDGVGVLPLDDAPDVTEEEVERAILDTGLFRTSRVFFEFGEAALLPVSQRVLRTVADVLVRYPDLQIEVGGHTDAISSDAFNLELSRRRAGSVAAFLIANGIRGERITSVGYGEARPVATNETETGRALNRRVEFVVVDPSAQ